MINRKITNYTRSKEKIASQTKIKNLENELKNFYDIGRDLSSEKDINKLLELILHSSMEMTSADAGTFYIIVDENDEWSIYDKNSKNKYLKFVIAKNNSIALNFESQTSGISKKSIAGNSIITGQSLRIDDVYELPVESEFAFNPNFDKISGYITKSMMTVPMKDHHNRIIGVIQLINKKISNEVTPFNHQDEIRIHSLAGEAAIAIENNIIYKNMENLLEKYRLLLTEEVSKRKLADEEIDKLLSAVEHSPVAVVITDPNGFIQYVNPKFTTLTGYAVKEVIGKKTNILRSGNHSQEFYQEFWETILTGKEWSGEFHDKKKNGDLYWESVSISSLKDEFGTIKYFIAVKEDITEKKSLYKKIEMQNIELQKTINQLNETQTQLIQKEKMAGIGQLAAGIAHEINNPLGFIMSNYKSLKKYVFKLKDLIAIYKDVLNNYSNYTNDEVKNSFTQISSYEEDNKIDFILDDISGIFTDTNEGLERVGNIVNAFRSFSHIDQLSTYGEYDLNDGIKTTLLIANSKIKYNAAIHEEYDELPSINAIGGEINQVILNLIINAAYAIELKHENSGGIINIKTYQNSENVYCEIEDNGAGIEKSIINRIFEPFYTTKPIGEGTGLGLSISYDIIVNKHKGEILIESEKNSGTKFTVKLPKK